MLKKCDSCKYPAACKSGIIAVSVGIVSFLGYQAYRYMSKGGCSWCKKDSSPKDVSTPQSDPSTTPPSVEL